MTRHKDLIDRQHELIRRRELDRIPELYEPTAVFKMPGGTVTPRQLPALMRAYLEAFPDLENHVTTWFESDDGIALEQVITGTHTGSMITPLGILEATGKPIRQEAVEIVRVRGGKIASWHSYVDQLPTMLELGFVVLARAFPGSAALDHSAQGSSGGGAGPSS